MKKARQERENNVMKNSLLAIALAAGTLPVMFGQASQPAQKPATSNPPAATSSTTAPKPKVKKHVKKSHVKKNKTTPATATSGAASK